MDILNSSELEEILKPLADGTSGENCEYDELYLKLDELALGTPDSQMGDSVISGKDPDYRALYKNCQSLWQKTRDLRVASFMTLAGVNLNGYEGLKGGLSVIRYLVTEMFDSFYPQLDPDDDNDPTERINILSMLSPEESAYADGYRFILCLRDVKLVPELPYSYRDYLVGTGFINASETDDIDINVFNTQMSTIPVASVQKQCEIIDEIIGLVDEIQSVFNEKVGNTGYLNFTSLSKELKGIRNIYQNSLSLVKPSSDAQPSADSTSENAENISAPAAAFAAPAQKAVFNLDAFVPKNRQEALLLLKKSSEYFEKAEPTSPVPFLVNRALKMSNMNFIDLLGEIDRDALSKGREQLGVPAPDGY